MNNDFLNVIWNSDIYWNALSMFAEYKTSARNLKEIQVVHVSKAGKLNPWIWLPVRKLVNARHFGMQSHGIVDPIVPRVCLWKYGFKF